MRAFLALALCSQRSEVLAALEDVHYAKNAYLEIEVEGVPGVRWVSLFVWPEPAGTPHRAGIDVVKLDKRVLRTPIETGFVLTDEERPRASHNLIVTAEELEVALEDPRPRTIRFDAAEWRLMPQAASVREVKSLDSKGRPVYGDVDTGIYCYKLVCPKCGRERYSKRNSLHQIRYCRVCTQAIRKRRQALDQFRDRTRRKPRAQATDADRARIVELWRTGEYSLRAIAAEVGLTHRGVVVILRRLGERL